MKNTGIVRRIDELGRVVIPVEYRKMHRINIGDPMEILATEQGDIIIRKIGMESEFISNARDVIESAELPFTVLVSDSMRWRVGTGSSKNQYLDKLIDHKFLTVIQTRKPLSDKADNGAFLQLQPIVGGDVFGLLMAVSSKPLTDQDLQTLHLLAKLIAKLTEKY